MKLFWQSLLGLTPMLIALSCARVPSAQTQLRFEWSNNSAFKAMNADGSQQMPAFFTVSRADGSQPMHLELLPNEARVLDLPRGSVVIQALMFTRLAYPGLSPSEDSGMQPYIALQEVTLDQPEQTVVLSLQAPRKFLTGEVAGRYLTAANSGPTGDIEYNIKLKAHLPPIKLSKRLKSSYMVNGWFQFFSLRSDDVLGMEYLMPDGTNVFGPGVIKNIDNLIEVNAGDQPTAQVQLSVPWSAKVWQDQNHNYYLDNFREPEIYTLGFWGPGRVVTQTARFYHTGANVDNVVLPNTYVYQSNLGDLASSYLASYQGSAANRIVINSSTSSLNDLYIYLVATTEVTAGESDQRGGGGAFLRGNHLGTTSGLNINDSLVLDPITLAQSGKDGFGAFRGFLRAENFPEVTNTPNPFNGWTTYRNSNDKLLHVLPGIKIEALNVYLNLGTDHQDDRGLNCLEMSNSELTVYSGDVHFNNEDQDTLSIQLNPFPSHAKNLILCPTFKQGYRPSRPTILHQHQYQGPCEHSPTPGTVCDDGSLYLGIRVSSPHNYKYFSAPASNVPYTWGPADTSSSLTSDEGETNSNFANGDYPAANFCKSSSSLSYTDWFLPSSAEFIHFHSTLDGLTNSFAMEAGDYWTSQQESNANAYFYATANGLNNGFSTKSNSKKIRCMRRVLINGY